MTAKTVLDLELPLFEDESPKDMESVLNARIEAGVAAALKERNFNTRIMLENDITRVYNHFATLAVSLDAVVWVQEAKKVADPHLATVTLVQNAVNFSLARGAGKGPHQSLHRDELARDLMDEVKSHFA